MKPILLKMQAFGSFMEETIDFSVLPDDLYLIAGDTGSGKTTIFDAIMFALYGKASGSDRSPKMLHSDYALGEKYKDTRVTLTFSQNDRVHTIERSLHLRKSRLTGDLDETPVQEAELWDRESGESVKGAEKVTARAEQLTGMGAEQFRKIAMLAQGEFRAFLADAKNRGDILSRLFDDTLYRRCEDILEGAKKKLQAVRDDQLKKIAIAVDAENLRLPDAMSEEERAGFAAVNPDLPEKLEQLIASERAEGEKRAAALRKNEERRNNLTLRLNAGEEINRRIDALEETRRQKAELEAKQADMDALQLRADAAERALNVVHPAEKARKEAAEGRARAQERLAQAEADVKNRAGLAEKAALALQEARKRQPSARRLRAEAAAIEKDLPKYAERTKAQAALAASTAAQKAAALKTEQAEKDLSGTREKLERITAALPGYEGAEAEAIRTENEQEKAQERVNAFSGKQGLTVSRDLVLEAGKECARLEEEWKKMVAAELGKKDVYDRAYKNFRLGQAGIMADLMRKKIAEKGTVRCPVCYAMYRTEDGHEFAPLPASTPTEAEVDAAKKDYDAARDAASRAETRCEKAKAALDSRKEYLLKAAQALGLAENAETLLAPGFLETKTAETMAAAHQAETAAQEAKKRAAENRRLTDEEKRLRRAEKTQQDALQAARQELQTASEAAKAAQGRLEGMGALPYESEAEAKQALAARNAAASEIEDGIRMAESADKDAGEALGTAQGAQASARVNLAEAGERCARTEEAYHAALTKAGMDEAAYRAALPADESQSARWRQELQHYQEEKASVCGRLKAAEEAVQGHPDRVDTQKDEAELQTAETERAALEEQKKQEEARRTTHENALATVKGAKQALAESDAAFLRLERLARLACNSDSTARDTKTSFSRYIQTYVFKEILEEANEHLSRMTAGRYRLEYRAKAKNGLSNSGLLIDVLDTTTNKTRDTASLSGGESFQASLALALGLSGVVQRHSGVCRVDSMFIDEGFGTLSEAELESAVCTLRDIARGGRQIGIISHVKRLEESIDSKIVVKRGLHGSTAEVQV